MKKIFLLLCLSLFVNAVSVSAKSFSVLPTQSNSFMPSSASSMMPSMGGGQFSGGGFGGAQFGSMGSQFGAQTPAFDKRSSEDKINQQRQLKYEALGLNQEQRGKAEIIDYKTRKALAPVVRKYKIATKKLHEMRAQHTSRLSVWRQQRVVNAYKKQMEGILKKSEHRFNSILSREQKEKMEMIEEQESAKLDRLKKEQEQKQAVIQRRLQRPAHASDVKTAPTSYSDLGENNKNLYSVHTKNSTENKTLNQDASRTQYHYFKNRDSE